MSEKDELAKVKAALAEKEKELAALKAAAPVSKAKDPAALRARRDARRAEVKAEAHKEDGHALYFIPLEGELFYRKGVCYPPGSTVRLPLDEDPSYSWEPVVKKASRPVLEPKSDGGSEIRAQDRQI